MATYSQVPGTMNLTFKAGDTFSTLIDFDVTLSGHTASSQVVSLVTGLPVQPLTTSMTDAAAGRVTISLTATQTISIPPATYGWQMSWVDTAGTKRTALSGVVEVVR